MGVNNVRWKLISVTDAKSYHSFCTYSEIFVIFEESLSCEIFWLLSRWDRTTPVGWPEADEELFADADELIVLRSKLEHLNASSRASIQHFPAALFGALNIKWEVGKGCTTAPIVSPSGPRAAQILWSIGWNNLKQNPSFLEGRSISSHVERIIVPIQWLLCNLNKY